MASVKKEKLDPKELDPILIDYCKKHPDGVNGQMVLSDLASYDASDCLGRLTKLSEQGKLLMTTKGKFAIFRYKEPSIVGKGIKFETDLEKMIFNAIRDSGRKGIWVKELRESLNIPFQQCTTVLKTLKAKGVAKELTAGAGGNKRMWLLAELEPDSEYVTSRGGPWFNESNGEIDQDIAKKLTEATLSVIQSRFNQFQADPTGPFEAREKSYISSEEICEILKLKSVVKVTFTAEHIQTLCDVLVWDRLAEKKITSSGAVYRHDKPVIEKSSFVEVPCGFCPVMYECSDDAVISPYTCVYYKKWLKDAETADIAEPDAGFQL